MLGSNKRLIVSFVQLILVSLLMIMTTLAWFTLLDNVDANLVGQTGTIEASYELYRYNEEIPLGNLNPFLYDQICTYEGQFNCYVSMIGNEVIELTTTSRHLYPGDKFSFAILISNQGDANGILAVAVSNLVATGYLLEVNKVQVAFSYVVTKIVYVDGGVMSDDIKETQDILYAGKNLLEPPLFTTQSNLHYSLASNLFLAKSGAFQQIILYFDLYFSPYVQGKDTEGISTGNSNVFQNQVFRIEKVLIHLT